MSNTRVVFDIETVGRDFDTLDPGQQEYLLRWAKSDEEREQIKGSLGLYPLYGEVVTIALLNPDTCQGVTYFQAPEQLLEPFEEEGVRYIPSSEPEMLRGFWGAVARYERIVTFNGRSFDCPYLLVRSAVHKIPPSRELIPNRYSDKHIDLLDRLTFFGAARRRFSLDAWCHAFGIKSPKEDGISGADVGRYFADGRHEEIARYCVRDVCATAELLQRYERYMTYPPVPAPEEP